MGLGIVYTLGGDFKVIVVGVGREWIGPFFMGVVDPS